MKILITHLGTIAQTLPATSILYRIRDIMPNSFMTWVVPDKKYISIFKYNKRIDKVILFNELKEKKEEYDVLINLHPFFPHKECPNVKIKNSFDFNFNGENKDFKDVLIGNKKIPYMNIFQMYYKMIGLTWKGEGYNIKYYPKTKSKNNRIGLALANANLRNYIVDKLNINKKLWHVPYKNNILRRMDEINRCKKIITDDMVTLHLSLNLKKYVYYMETIPSNIKLELFNSGEVHSVPKWVIN
ncbi:hypothetical protein K9M42_03090 [Patescibacteria group bacterium]|nr:hypothetical protein [Patescibacteria group bacterium]